MTYETTTDQITVVDGVEVDVTVRDTGGGERKADHVSRDLKERLGVLAAAFDSETPPDDIEDVPGEYTPMMTNAWGRIFGDDDADTGE